MKANQVRDILVPIANLPHIDRNASMRDAFAVLRQQHRTAGWRIRHLLLIVLGLAVTLLWPPLGMPILVK